MIQIIVEKSLAEALNNKTESTAHSSTMQFFDKKKLVLKPVFQDAAEDPELSKFFSLNVSADKSEALLPKLLELPGIEAAYLKPDEELPI